MLSCFRELCSFCERLLLACGPRGSVPYGPLLCVRALPLVSCLSKDNNKNTQQQTEFRAPLVLVVSETMLYNVVGAGQHGASFA
jgi:hypothetical protein